MCYCQIFFSTVNLIECLCLWCNTQQLNQNYCWLSLKWLVYPFKSRFDPTSWNVYWKLLIPCPEKSRPQVTANDHFTLVQLCQKLSVNNIVFWGLMTDEKVSPTRTIFLSDDNAAVEICKGLFLKINQRNLSQSLRVKMKRIKITWKGTDHLYRAKTILRLVLLSLSLGFSLEWYTRIEREQS